MFDSRKLLIFIFGVYRSQSISFNIFFIAEEMIPQAPHFLERELLE